MFDFTLLQWSILILSVLNVGFVTILDATHLIL